MAESLQITQDAPKDQVYEEIIPQIKSLIDGEENLIANLANICGVLDMAFGHLWTGFYVRDRETLVLGPFQGPIACTRIPLAPIARGVCGAAAAGKTNAIGTRCREISRTYSMFQRVKIRNCRAVGCE